MKTNDFPVYSFGKGWVTKLYEDLKKYKTVEKQITFLRHVRKDYFICYGPGDVPKMGLDFLEKEIEYRVQILRDAGVSIGENLDTTLRNSKIEKESINKLDPNKIHDLTNKLRIVLRKDDKFKEALELEQKDRYEFVKKLMKKRYPRLTEKHFIGSKQTLERYLKEKKLLSIVGKTK